MHQLLSLQCPSTIRASGWVHITFPKRCHVITTHVYHATISYNANMSPRGSPTHHIHLDNHTASTWRFHITSEQCERRLANPTKGGALSFGPTTTSYNHTHQHLAPEPLVPSFNLTHPSSGNSAAIVIQTSCDLVWPDNLPPPLFNNTTGAHLQSCEPINKRRNEQVGYLSMANANATSTTTCGELDERAMLSASQRPLRPSSCCSYNAYILHSCST